MLVHLGSNVVVDARQVVAILDARRLGRMGSIPEVAVRVQGRGTNPQSAWSDTRAIVVTTGGVYPVPIAPITVAKRILALGNFRR